MEKTREDYTANINMEYRFDPDKEAWSQVNGRLPEAQLKRMTKADLILLHNKMYTELERSGREVADCFKQIKEQNKGMERQNKLIEAMVNMALLIPHGKG